MKGCERAGPGVARAHDADQRELDEQRGRDRQQRRSLRETRPMRGGECPLKSCSGRRRQRDGGDRSGQPEEEQHVTVGHHREATKPDQNERVRQAQARPHQRERNRQPEEGPLEVGRLLRRRPLQHERRNVLGDGRAEEIPGARQDARQEPSGQRNGRETVRRHERRQHAEQQRPCERTQRRLGRRRRAGRARGSVLAPAREPLQAGARQIRSHQRRPQRRQPLTIDPYHLHQRQQQQARPGAATRAPRFERRQEQGEKDQGHDDRPRRQQMAGQEEAPEQHHRAPVAGHRSSGALGGPHQHQGAARHQQRFRQRDSEQTGGAMNGGDSQLKEPVQIDPGAPGGAQREGIHAQQRAPVQHLAARCQMPEDVAVEDRSKGDGERARGQRREN